PAAERVYLVVLGVKPPYPAAGYGYIKVGERLHTPVPTALVDRFVEKPDAASAAEMVSAGDHLWNAGVFVWRAYAYRQALELYQPELAAGLAKIAALTRPP